MDKIKKYAKMIIDEINSAAEYADMACKFKTLDIELSDEYKSMAEDELHHKSIICKTLEKYIEQQADESGENREMNVIFDFVIEIIGDMESPIKSKLILLK